MKYFIIIGLIFLTACVEKQATSLPTKKQAVAQIKLEDQKECLGFGFKENTESYANCQLQLYLINHKKIETAEETTKPDCPVYSCE